MKILRRFLTYIKLDTQSDENSPTSPSTAKQLVLAKRLVNELIELGLKDAELDEYGIVYATLPANTDKPFPTIGFVAHMDTASEMSGKNVRARIIENYDGKDILLNETLNIILSSKEFPPLKTQVGKTLIVTDGTTLLGADNKAGIAIIMRMLEKIEDENIIHGKIKIAFTPDEEIGRGTVNFNVKKFGADFAYTIDGGPIDQINYENFNASSATVEVSGAAIHPGSGKDRLYNSQNLAMEFHGQLPPKSQPLFTEDYAGFYHLTNMQGSVEKTVLHYILRDHDLAKLHALEQTFQQCGMNLNNKYAQNFVKVTIKDGYRNMAPLILKNPEVLKVATKAFDTLNIPHSFIPIRGGTDGANLSYMGLLTPNLGTGGYNFHGKYEYAVIEEMLMMVNILSEIIRVK